MTPDRAALALDALRVAATLAALVTGLFGAAALLAWALDLDGYRTRPVSTDCKPRTTTPERTPR